MSGNMSALLQALKQKQGAAPTDPGDGMGPSSSADPSDPSDPTDDPSDPATDAMNAAIVGILQTTYPKIFAKVSEMAEQQSQDDPEAQAGPAPSADPMAQS